MLKFDVSPLLKLNGAKSRAAFIQSKGFSINRAAHLVSDNVKRISISDIDKLCRVFNCTPNDLFTYEESPANPLPQNSALKKLIRSTDLNVNDLIKGLSVEDAKSLINKFAEIKNNTLK